ncbi:MAG: GIY-YIG nuclease family protein [Candidatus Babeliales bacterium]
MHFIYLIQSIKYPEQYYFGQTINLKLRLAKHNEGGSSHTSKYRPWKIITYLAFEDKEKAIAFEKFIKSGSGREFAKKRLL